MWRASTHARNSNESKQDGTSVAHRRYYFECMTWCCLVGDQLRDKIRSWLSPPDPWTNYNTAREAHHPGSATWFIQGNMFGKWKLTGSLLWVNGLRVHFSSPVFPYRWWFQIHSWFRKDYHFVCHCKHSSFGVLISPTVQPSSKTSRTCVGLD